MIQAWLVTVLMATMGVQTETIGPLNQTRYNSGTSGNNQVNLNSIRECVFPQTNSDGKLTQDAYMWNTYPAMIQVAGVVIPNSEEEVIQIIKCARQMNATVSAKSGGHSYEGYWRGNGNGIAIDLKNIRNIIFDGNKKTIKVGAGSLLGPVTAKLLEESQNDQEFTYILPHGLQPMVGVGGHTLGGGFGLFSRNHKILVDTVKEITMINYKGEKIIANKDNNSELFTALRGAGAGSFGIVTSIEYEYVKLPKKITVLRYNWFTSRENFTSVWNTIMDYYGKQTDSGVTHYVNFKPGGQVEMGATLSHMKSEHQKECLDKMEKNLKPDVKDSSVREFLDAYRFFAGMAGAETNMTIEQLKNTPITAELSYYKGRSGYFAEPLKNEVVTKQLGNYLHDSPKAGFFLLVDLWRGKIMEEDCDAPTSFVHRDILASAQIGTYENDTASIQLSQNVYNLLKPHFPQAYQNYMDRNEQQFMTTYYGHMAKYLVEVKRKWDPTNMFKFERSIPLQLSNEEQTIWKSLRPTSLKACCNEVKPASKCRLAYPSNKNRSYCDYPGFKLLKSNNQSVPGSLPKTLPKVNY